MEARKMAIMVLAVIVAVLLAASGDGVKAAAGIQCGDAIQKMIPCETFLLGTAAKPSASCCSGAQALDRIAVASREDKRALCQCLKDTAKSFPVNPQKAKQIQTLCKLQINTVIDPSVDCNTI